MVPAALGIVVASDTPLLSVVPLHVPATPSARTTPAKLPAAPCVSYVNVTTPADGLDAVMVPDTVALALSAVVKLVAEMVDVFWFAPRVTVANPVFAAVHPPLVMLNSNTALVPAPFVTFTNWLHVTLPEKVSVADAPDPPLMAPSITGHATLSPINVAIIAPMKKGITPPCANVPLSISIGFIVPQKENVSRAFVSRPTNIYCILYALLTWLIKEIVFKLLPLRITSRAQGRGTAEAGQRVSELR